MALNLPWWELEEFLEHVDLHPAWHRSGRFILRSVYREDVYGVLVNPPTTQGRFRQGTLIVQPLKYDAETAETDLLYTLNTFTAYGTRHRLMEIYRSIPQIDPGIIQSLAIATMYTTVTEPYDEAKPITEFLPPDEEQIGLFHLVGGGYVRLRYRNGRIFGQISIPSARGGYDSIPLSGILRPANGSSLDTAGRIAGWQSPPADTVEVSQPELEGVEWTPSQSSMVPTGAADESRTHRPEPEQDQDV